MPIIALILALLLVGCASPEQIAARHNETCQSYGALPGSPEYADCRVRLAEMQNQRDMERRRAVGALGRGLSNASNCPPGLSAGQAFACGLGGSR